MKKKGKIHSDIQGQVASFYLIDTRKFLSIPIESVLSV